MERIHPSFGPSAPRPGSASHPPVGSARTSFQDHLATPAASKPVAATGPLAPPRVDATTELLSLVSAVRRDERRLDRYLRRARAGAHFELSELVAMQSLVHRYTQKVELLSKLVDRACGALKQTLNTPI